MTDYLFQEVPVYDRLGVNLMLARGVRIDVLDKDLDVVSPGLKQDGQPVPYITTDQLGRATFTNTQGFARLRSARGFEQIVYSPDFLDEVKAAPAAAQASADSSAASATAAQNAANLVGAPADSAVSTLVNGAATQTRAALDGRYPKKGDLSLNVKDYGAVGDGTTDDTAAFEAVIAVLAGITDSPISGRFHRRPDVYVPAGVYRITRGLPVIMFKGFTLRGDGAQNTSIYFDTTADVPVFDIGAFQTAPAAAWTDGSNGKFTGIRIQKPILAAGSRVGQGIRSSGNGDLTLEDVAVCGFKYGINSPYGGDFNSYTHVWVEYCDVGIYQGPGGQQFSGFHVHLFQCGEALVLDRASQVDWTLPIFNSPTIAAVVFEGGNTTTRQLTSLPAGYNALGMESKVVFRGAWIESAADGTDTYVPDHFVKFNSTSSSYSYRGIEFQDPFIVAGRGPTKSVTSLMSFPGTGAPAKNVAVRRPVLIGTMARWLTDPQGVRIESPRQFQAAIPWSNANTFDSYRVEGLTDGMASGETRRVVPQLPLVESTLVDGTDLGYAQKGDGLGIVSWGFRNAGAWLYRMGMDIQNARLYLGDPSSSSSMIITRATAMPTSGTYGIGSFVHNTAPTVSAGKVLLGWKRLTTGSAHVAGTDWTPVYATTT